MRKVYASYVIHTTAEFSPKTNCWVPHAIIFSETDPVREEHALIGRNNIFSSKGAAETYAVEIAIWWIDDQNNRLLANRRSATDGVYGA